MTELPPESELASLLSDYRRKGGVLEFVFLEAESGLSDFELHHRAAVAGMSAIADRAGARRFSYDAESLTGQRVPYSTFWGNDDIGPEPSGDRAYAIPIVDGYKTAFFWPPYSLLGSRMEHAELFARITLLVLGEHPERADVFSWSTDWSDYFDAGHEWWGAFYWTVRPHGGARLAVIGASATD